MSYGIALGWTIVAELELVKNAAGLSLPLAQDATEHQLQVLEPRNICIQNAE